MWSASADCRCFHDVLKREFFHDGVFSGVRGRRFLIGVFCVYGFSTFVEIRMHHQASGTPTS